MDDTVKNKYYVILIIGAMSTAGLFWLSGSVVGQTISDSAVGAQPTFFITSRFILWDKYEKSIDRNFQITLISWVNNTNNYSININTDYYNGTFYQIIQKNFTYSNITHILNLKIIINNITYLEVYDIRIISGITQSAIDIIEPYKISFLPIELSRFKWNLIFSGIIGVVLSLPTAYYTVKYYRKHKGAQVL